MFLIPINILTFHFSLSKFSLTFSPLKFFSFTLLVIAFKSFIFELVVILLIFIQALLLCPPSSLVVCPTKFPKYLHLDYIMLTKKLLSFSTIRFFTKFSLSPPKIRTSHLVWFLKVFLLQIMIFQTFLNIKHKKRSYSIDLLLFD